MLGRGVKKLRLFTLFPIAPGPLVGHSARDIAFPILSPKIGMVELILSSGSLLVEQIPLAYRIFVSFKCCIISIEK